MNKAYGRTKVFLNMEIEQSLGKDRSVPKHNKIEHNLGKDRGVPKHYVDGTKFRLGNTLNKDKKNIFYWFTKIFY